MARPLRIEYPGALYHVTARGNERRDIFTSNHDRNQFLHVLGKIVESYGWICHAYCLMDNHYHLLIETPDANLSKGMRDLNGIYSQRFNRIHNRDGHVFQGRFKSFVIEKDSYLQEVARYTVLNPVRAEMVEKPGQWKWSSYRATMGLCRPIKALDVNSILRHFSDDQLEARRKYKDYIKEGIGGASPFDKAVEGNVLGLEPFSDLVLAMTPDIGDLTEVPMSERIVGRPTLDAMLNSSMSKGDRNSAIVIAHLRGGYTQKEIADFVNIHYSTVSKIIANSRFKT